MRLCRYNNDKLGLVKGDQLIDVTLALEAIPETRWPRPHGDAMIAHLEAIREGVLANQKNGYVQGVANVVLRSPVANPTKIIGAPANYMDHVAEARRDPGINFGRETRTIEACGLFLKANSSLTGAGEGVDPDGDDRRVDHEVEVAAIIGRTAKNVARDEALDCVAGYAIGLDVTVRGVEDRSLRKSLDSFAVLGPWMTTADEIDDPDDLGFRLAVNGENPSGVEHAASRLRFSQVDRIRFPFLHPLSRRHSDDGNSGGESVRWRRATASHAKSMQSAEWKSKCAVNADCRSGGRRERCVTTFAGLYVGFPGVRTGGKAGRGAGGAAFRR